MIKVLKVYDHTKFRRFEYVSEQSPIVRLGDIMYKHTPAGDGYPEDNEIGVVIQTFDDQEFRVDMWGMTGLSECSFATRGQVKKYRPNIVDDIQK